MKHQNEWTLDDDYRTRMLCGCVWNDLQGDFDVINPSCLNPKPVKNDVCDVSDVSTE